MMSEINDLTAKMIANKNYEVEYDDIEIISNKTKEGQYVTNC